jgi:hypothetical protein
MHGSLTWVFLLDANVNLGHTSASNMDGRERSGRGRSGSRHGTRRV